MMAQSHTLDANFLLWDALKELANIGSGSALTSLSRLVSKSPSMLPWLLDVPTLHAPNDALAKPAITHGDAAGMAVGLGVRGPSKGTFVLLFDADSARSLVQSLTGIAGAELGLGSMGNSALLEVGNIVSCAFLDAISGFVGGALMPSTPKLTVGTVHQLTELYAGSHCMPVTVQTNFRNKAGTVCGSLVFILDEAVAHSLAPTLGIPLNISPAIAQTE